MIHPAFLSLTLGLDAVRSARLCGKRGQGIYTTADRLYREGTSDVTKAVAIGRISHVRATEVLCHHAGQIEKDLPATAEVLRTAVQEIRNARA